jgi:Transglycosylase SLT domain
MTERRERGGEQSSELAAYLKRKAALKLLAKVGKAKLLIAAAAVLGAFLAFLILLAALAGASDSSESVAGALSCTAPGGADSPPAALAPIYAAAAQKYRLGPRGEGILAAINKVETDFGRSTLPGVHSGSNSAGAEGPMQFLAGTWETYGVDGNGDGVADPYDETDAVFGAANLLSSDGAPGDWYGAIFEYNHADWYVREVLRIARGYGAVQCTQAAASTQPGSLPSQPLARIAYLARWIQEQRIPYCWGGGHGPAPGPSAGSYCWNARGEQVSGGSETGLDCSGSVRWLLALAGYPDPGPLVSGDFAGAYPSGRGAQVTIWSNADHVFVEIDGVDWGTSSSHFAHGPGFGYQPSAGFAASHPAGL